MAKEPTLTTRVAGELGTRKKITSPKQLFKQDTAFFRNARDKEEERPCDKAIWLHGGRGSHEGVRS